TGIRKLGLKILGTVLLNGNKKIIRDLEKEVKILETKISKKNNELAKMNGKLKRTRLTHKGLSRKIYSMKKIEFNGHQNNGSAAPNGVNGFGEIKKKYPNLPKNEIERIEVERTIARYLMGQNSGCFYVSQILKTLQEIYSIEPDDKIMLLTEIRSWIERDPLCRIVKTIDKVHNYAFI
ncbi:MAG: hypothetical protein AABX78_02595, partial [Nanoarchaeota archaeon]